MSGVRGGRVGRFRAEPSPTSEDLARFLSAARSRGSATQVRSTRQLVARSGFACATFAAAFSISLAIFPHETRAIAFLSSSPQLSPQAHEENQMRSLKSIGQKSFGVLSSLAIAAGASAQDAVQWRVEDGGNGHWYQIVSLGQSFTSITQCTAAIAQIGGSPCVFDNAAEWNWWTVNYVGQPHGGHAHQGLYRAPNQPWRTFDGREPPFTAWTPGLPNNPASDYVIATAVPASNAWEDYVASDTQFRVWTVEWSADCNSDGLVDYGQIRAGELEDANGNNIPDCCEQSTSCEPCAADIDGSGTVNAVDLAAILTVWGTDGGKYPNADIDGDGEVNGPDLAAVLSSWGACP